MSCCLSESDSIGLHGVVAKGSPDFRMLLPLFVGFIYRRPRTASLRLLLIRHQLLDCRVTGLLEESASSVAFVVDHGVLPVCGDVVLGSWDPSLLLLDPIHEARGAFLFASKRHFLHQHLVRGTLVESMPKRHLFHDLLHLFLDGHGSGVSRPADRIDGEQLVQSRLAVRVDFWQNAHLPPIID